MIGSELHDVVRQAGAYDGDGQWNPAAAWEEFQVMGLLEQVSPAMLALDPMNPRIVSAWRLLMEPMERELAVASGLDGRGGDRVRHRGRLLAVVGSREAPSVGGIASMEYHLIDPGQDTREVIA